MKTGYSRLIIREFILPDTDAPLLASCNDIRMMVLLTGMERTEGQWKELLNAVGLEIVGFCTVVKGGEGVIEAVKSAAFSGQSHDKSTDREEAQIQCG